jgi:hypothetical protein
VSFLQGAVAKEEARRSEEKSFAPIRLISGAIVMKFLFEKFAPQKKEALGLAVSGTEVRLAHLVNDKGRIRIEGLERAKLRSSMEAQKPAPKTAEVQDAETADLFGLKSTSAAKNNAPPQEDFAPDHGNMEVLYGLLDKFTRQKRVKIGFNVPLSMVSYNAHTPLNAGASPAMSVVERLGGAEKDAGLDLTQYALRSADGAAKLNMFYEKHPPTLALLQEIKTFTKGNLYLGQMQTPELALLNLARASVELEEGKITAIIYLEEDFSRLIFLRGNEVLHVSSLINESATSPEILEVVYRRLIYEQDEAQIPEVNAILITGKGGRVRAKEFFAKHCTGVQVSYLATDQLGSFPANETQRAVFSEFAVAIALAWQLLEPKRAAFIPIDLLPSEIKDQQEVLKLDYSGYALLGLTGLVAFFFTWQILGLKSDANSIRGQNQRLEEKIRDNQPTVDKVHKLENECDRLKMNLALADTLGRGYDEFLRFTQKLNTSVLRTGSVWVDEISRQSGGFTISGGAMQRERIPLLAERLEQASLRQVTRAENGKQKIFRFELERQNQQSTYAFSAGGIRIIDSNQGGGNLILGKENEPKRSVPPPQPEIKPQTATPKPREESLIKTKQSSANGVIKEASASRPAPNEAAKNAAGTRTAETARVTPKTEPSRQANSGPIAAAKTSNEAPANKAGERNAPAVKSGERLASKENSGVSSNPSSAAQSQSASSSLPQSEGKSAPLPAKSAPQYRWYSIEAATSPRADYMAELRDAYIRQGYKAALGTFYDEKEGQKMHRVLIGLYNSRAAAEQVSSAMGKLLMPGYRIVGIE